MGRACHGANQQTVYRIGLSMQSRIGPVSAVAPALSSDQSYGGTVRRMTVAANSIGFGAVLRPSAVGLILADSTPSPYPGLFIALEAGTGERSVLCWGGGVIRNDSWSLTPLEVLYLSSTPGVFTQNDTGGTPVGFAESATVVNFGPVHDSFTSAPQPATVTITHTGQTFQPRAELDTTTYPDATILWTYADETTSTEALPPVKDFGTAASRQTVCEVTPAAALTSINVGYDGSDGGDYWIDPVEHGLAAQSVTAIEGLQSAPGLLWVIASSNPITAIDLSGLASLTVAEFFQSNLESIALTGATSLRRLCTEENALSTLDVSSCVATIEDLRSAAQSSPSGLTSVNFGANAVCPNLWHLCVRNNSSLNIPELAILASFPAMRELYIWNCGQTALSLQGSNYTQILAANNPLASVNISGAQCGQIDLQNGQLDQAAGDTIIGDVEAWGTSGGSLGLLGNAAPSAAGLADRDLLLGRSWSVSVTESSAPTISALSPLDNATGIAVDTSLSVQFSEAVTAQAGGTIELRLTSNDSLVESFDVTADITGDGTDTIGFTPAASLDNSVSYYVQISADAFENSVSVPFAGILDTATWNLETVAADVPVPVVQALDPLDDATGVAVDATFSATFNVPVFAGTGDAVFHNASDAEVGRVAASTFTGLGTSTVSFSPPTNLANETGHYIQIEADALQNSESEFFAGILDTTTWSFTTAAVSSALWSDDFNRADGPAGNGWTSPGAAVGSIVSNELSVSGGGGYQVLNNPTDVTLPADYRVIVTIPHSRLSESYWGIALRYLSGNGTRIFFEGPTNVTVGDADWYNSGNVTVTVTGGFPASWSLNQDHTIGAEIIGTTVRILLDGQEYGTATHAVNNQVGTGIAIVGETNNRTWDDVIVEAIP